MFTTGHQGPAEEICSCLQRKILKREVDEQVTDRPCIRGPFEPPEERPKRLLRAGIAGLVARIAENIVKARPNAVLASGTQEQPIASASFA